MFWSFNDPLVIAEAKVPVMTRPGSINSISIWNVG
jgi:hypothetical protein